VSKHLDDTVEEGDEAAGVFAATQAYKPNPVTGVYWNYDASPSEREKLRVLMASESDNEDIQDSPRTGLTPVNHLRIRFRSKIREKSPPKMMDQEEAKEDLLDFFKDIHTNLQACNKTDDDDERPPESVVSTPPCHQQQTPKPSQIPSKKDDLFFNDSADDSFLIRCTQAAEEAFKRPIKVPEFSSKDKGQCSSSPSGSVPTQVVPRDTQPKVIQQQPPKQVQSTQIKKPTSSNDGKSSSNKIQKVAAPPPATPSTGSLFDDDDDFDFMLSQMEIPTVQQKPDQNNMSDNTKSTSVVSKSVVSSNKPPTNKIIQATKNATTLSSANNVPSRLVGTPGSSWRRNYSSPEATTTSGALLPSSAKNGIKQRHQTVCGGSGGSNLVTSTNASSAAVKCTKDEIERKRLEAIKRRQLSQKAKKAR